MQIYCIEHSIFNIQYKKGSISRYKCKYMVCGLMKDIKRYEREEQEEEEEEISEKEQLCYVLPNESMYLVSGGISKGVIEAEYEYAYRRYFWEAHPKLPEIDIDEIKKLLKK